MHMHVNIVKPLASVKAFLDWQGFAKHQVGYGQLVKMLITLDPHGIFWSNFAYLYIF